jgi:hypothetical protein
MDGTRQTGSKFRGIATKLRAGGQLDATATMKRYGSTRLAPFRKNRDRCRVSVMSVAQAEHLPADVQGAPPAQRGRAMVGVMMAVALATLDTAIANTALPTIAADLGSIRVLPYGS